MYRKFFLSAIGLFFIFSLAAQQKIRLEIISLPADTPPGSNIFIAGSFNSWNPQNKNFQFQKNEKGYYIELSLPPGNYEYKLTRGSWDKVECSAGGLNLANRSLNVLSEDHVEISVTGWKDMFAVDTKKSTANKNVQVIDTAFYMPKLGRHRRVWIYLPPSYSNSSKKYPVLYMHDGQNLFDDITSYAGEWGVDEALDTLGLKIKECIVVGIDNGGEKRLNEYCPYDFDLKGIAANYPSGKGEGPKYVDFLVKTLKPFIDKKYRTLKDGKNTFVAGSSMGGLISLYAVIRYPKKFGGAGVFSPAFWVGPKIMSDIKAKGSKVRSKIYFYAGNEEGETMVPMTIQAFNEMRRVSNVKMATVIRGEGRHNEARWRMEFPAFYEWLLK